MLSDVLTVIAVIAGFAFLIALRGWIGAGSHDSLTGLISGPALPARPRGTQEQDLPRFAL
jgi:hypothetical protein